MRAQQVTAAAAATSAVISPCEQGTSLMSMTYQSSTHVKLSFCFSNVLTHSARTHAHISDGCAVRRKADAQHIHNLLSSCGGKHPGEE
jgi:hypothetical protein